MIYIRKFDKGRDLEKFIELERENNLSGKLFDTVIESLIDDLDDEKILRYAIVDKETDEVYGLCQLDMTKRNKPELGLNILKKHQGKGYGTKAAELLIEQASAWDFVESFKWNARTENARSRRIAEKLGGVYVGEKLLFPVEIMTFAIKKGIFSEEEVPRISKYEIAKNLLR